MYTNSGVIGIENISIGVNIFFVVERVEGIVVVLVYI